MSDPEFGPGGYLPPKASQRARKIVLREQMGWGWPLAAAGAAVLVVLAGVVFLRTASQPPEFPYQRVVELSEVAAPGAEVISAGPYGGVDRVLVVRAAGGVSTFLAVGQEPEWCPETRRLETAEAAWTQDGRVAYGVAESLVPLRSVVFDGILYVDFVTPLDALPPAPQGPPPACAGLE